MAPLPSTKVPYDSPTALKILIDEAAVELHSEKFRYAERTAHYIEVTWQQFLSYCHSRGLEKYLPKYKDEFLADLCSRTPALKASTIKRKDSHMKMLDMFIRNGTWEKGNLDPLQELLMRKRSILPKLVDLNVPVGPCANTPIGFSDVFKTKD